LGDFGQRQLPGQRCSGCGESGNARRNGVRDIKRLQAPRLFAKRAPDRQIAGMKTRNILAAIRRSHDLGDNLIKRHGRRINDARRVRAVAEQSLRHQGTGIEADRATSDQIAPPHRDKVGGARSGSDKMNCHEPSLMAMAQVTFSAATRAPRRRAL
jgi:hypothetical protein